MDKELNVNLPEATDKEFDPLAPVPEKTEEKPEEQSTYYKSKKDKQVRFKNEMVGISDSFTWSVGFDSALEPNTVTNSTFILTDDLGNVLPAKVEYDDIFSKADITIKDRYAENKTYYLILTPNIRSKTGGRVKKCVAIKFSCLQGIISSQYMPDVTAESLPILKKIAKDNNIQNLLPPVVKKKLSKVLVPLFVGLFVALIIIYGTLWLFSLGPKQPPYNIPYDYEWLVLVYSESNGAYNKATIPEGEKELFSYDFENALGSEVEFEPVMGTEVLESVTDGELRHITSLNTFKEDGTEIFKYGTDTLMLTLKGFKGNKFRFYLHTDQQNTQTAYTLRIKAFKNQRLNNEIVIDPRSIPVSEANKKLYVEIDFKNGYASLVK